MINRLRGLGVAVITPFLESGEIDFSNLEKLVENLIQNGVDYLVALGTTSEIPTLSEKKKMRSLNTSSGLRSGVFRSFAVWEVPIHSKWFNNYKKRTLPALMPFCRWPHFTVVLRKKVCITIITLCLKILRCPSFYIMCPRVPAAISKLIPPFALPPIAPILLPSRRHPVI